MEAKSVRCLTNSISRFILLVSCQTSKFVPTQKDLESMANLMKHLKPVLDEITDDEIISDEIYLKECENLDIAANEAREFVERWCSKSSKIWGVWQSELLLSKMKSSALEICHILCKLLRASPSASSIASVQNCMQELQYWKTDQWSTPIEQALRGQNGEVVVSSNHLTYVIELLGLASNHELLRESIAIEKQRMRAQANNLKAEVQRIDRIVDLLSLIREHLLKTKYFDAAYGVPIPSYFRCPLSLQIMVDPVIVASGQTFERASIRKWLDHGLTICPQTRQPLSHINIISNYTIKALISNWFEEKNLKLPNTSRTTLTSAQSPSNCGSSQDVIHTDSFRGSQNSSNSTSRSSHELGDVNSRQKPQNEQSGFGEEASCMGQSVVEIEKAGEGHTSPEHSYAHSRTQSISSAVSVNDYLPPETEFARISNKLDKVGPFSNEVKSECYSSLANTSLSGRGSYSYSSKSSTEISDSRVSSHRGRAHSLPSCEAGLSEPTTSSYVEKLLEDLRSQSIEAQTSAASELRLLTKHSTENRVIIGKCGAVVPLVSLLYSSSRPTQEHAVTALLNLSINQEIKMMIGEAGVIEPIIHVLRSGNDAAKENSAATLFSLSALEEQKVKIGRSGAVKALVDLLSSGSIRGKKDAATALFNLSICHENKVRIVQAGAVKHLVEFLNHDSGLADKAIALLANLSTVSEGRVAISRAGGIPLVVEILESGSQRTKENAASVLLQLCLNSNKFCSLVLQEGAVPPLVALSQSGTTRAKEKAQQLLSHFRSQREEATARKKSSK